MIPFLRNTEDAVQYGLGLFPADIVDLEHEITTRTEALRQLFPHMDRDEQLAKAVSLQLLGEAVAVARGEAPHLLALFRASGKPRPAIGLRMQRGGV